MFKRSGKKKGFTTYVRASLVADHLERFLSIISIYCTVWNMEKGYVLIKYIRSSSITRRCTSAQLDIPPMPSGRDVKAHEIRMNEVEAQSNVVLGGTHALPCVLCMNVPDAGICRLFGSMNGQIHILTIDLIRFFWA